MSSQGVASMTFKKESLRQLSFPALYAIYSYMLFIYGGGPAQVLHLIPYSVTAYKIW
jgi:hypothetical protein